MATDKELSDFLRSVERRAFKTAMYAVRNEETALDLVQDAMLRLAEKYGDKPAEELPLLFTRILQNATLDHFRRQKVRNTWVSLLSAFSSEDDDDADPLEFLCEEGSNHESAEREIERSQVMAIIEEAISALPGRQREAFLLRYWEEYDLAETAHLMGCSEGSVKTHCSRATHALATALKKKGVNL